MTNHMITDEGLAAFRRTGRLPPGSLVPAAGGCDALSKSVADRLITEGRRRQAWATFADMERARGC
jgi:hypothetical protein